jgi:WD40 repeat protein
VLGRKNGEGAKEMAGLVGIAGLADLTPLVAAEAGAAEGDPRPVYTWTGPAGDEQAMMSSYLPSDGGAPRLVAAGIGGGATLCVWDTGTGALLRALQGPDHVVWSLVAYQRRSDGSPRIGAGSDEGHLSIWDGDDFQLVHTIRTDREACRLHRLAVYEEPTSGMIRLVTG